MSTVLHEGEDRCSDVVFCLYFFVRFNVEDNGGTAKVVNKMEGMWWAHCGK